MLRSLINRTRHQKVARFAASPSIECIRRQLASGGAAPESPSEVATLHEAWPELQRLFKKMSNSDGQFPLLTQRQRDQFSRHYNWEANDVRQAAVLVLLCNVAGNPSIIFTRRSAHLNVHASEISFPGGHFEADQDLSLEETALRETDEELLPPPGFLDDHVDILGSTTRLPSIKGTPVTPVIAVLWKELDEPVSKVFPGDPSEVDLVFSVSIEALLEKETSHHLPTNRFKIKEAPLFPTPHGDIWGLTAYILRPLLHRLLRPVFFKESQ